MCGLLDRSQACCQQTTCAFSLYETTKKSKRKVQRVPQSQAAAHPRHREEAETDKTKQAQTKSTKISSLFHKRGNRSAKRTEKYNNRITQGKT